MIRRVLPRIGVCLALCWLSGVLASACAAGETAAAASAIADRDRSGAPAHEAAAVDAYAQALRSLRDRDVAASIPLLRESLRLDPTFLPSWLALARLEARHAPARFPDALEGITSAIAKRYDAQRILLALLVSGVWLALVLAACGTAAGLATRHVRSVHHGLAEVGKGIFGAGRTSAAAIAILAIPLLLPWGLAAASCAILGLTWFLLERRERWIAGCVVAILATAPHVLPLLAVYTDPPARDDLPALIDRVQRDVASPALLERIEGVRRDEGGAASAFAAGLAYRRAGRQDDAERAFTEAASADGVMGAHAVVNLGNIHFWRGDIMGAARRYETKLDTHGARLEARYNLAVSLARLHRFAEADQRLAEASDLDFDRVRDEARKATDNANADVMDGVLTPEQLWSLHRALPSRAGQMAPPLLYPFPALSPLILAGALAAGLACGTRLRRAVHVYACVRCHGPICRRCVTRIAGRVHCPRCARVLDGLDRSAHSLLLLRRILGKDLEGIERLRGVAVYAAPGIGAIVQGASGSGIALAILFTTGIVFGAGLLPDMLDAPSVAPVTGVLTILGWSLAAVAWGLSAAVVRSRRAHRKVRSYFDGYHGDRLAA